MKTVISLFVAWLAVVILVPPGFSASKHTFNGLGIGIPNTWNPAEAKDGDAVPIRCLHPDPDRAEDCTSFNRMQLFFPFSSKEWQQLSRESAETLAAGNATNKALAGTLVYDNSTWPWSLAVFQISKDDPRAFAANPALQLPPETAPYYQIRSGIGHYDPPTNGGLGPQLRSQSKKLQELPKTPFKE